MARDFPLCVAPVSTDTCNLRAEGWSGDPLIARSAHTTSKPVHTRVWKCAFVLVVRRPTPAASLDFESAAMVALQEDREVISIYGYFFHLFTCLDRRITSEGLRERYLEDRDFRHAVRMLTPLAFLPQHKGEVTFDELMDVAFPKTDTRVINFLKYVRNTWIAGMQLGRGRRLKAAPTFPSVIWSVCGRHQVAATCSNDVAANLHMKYSTYVADGPKPSYKKLCGLPPPPGAPDETRPRRVSLWPRACATSMLRQAECRAGAADGPPIREVRP